jgi:hypothetical protein
MSLIQVNSISARTGTTVTVLSNLKLNSVQAGTSVNNLGIDASGNVIIGAAGGSGSTANISDALYTVNNLSANGTSSATTSVCIYGVNVFTGATTTNYATKLPQPVTGKSVKIVNNTTQPISMYPANVGGKINNLPINTPLIIPADGKVYEYICTLNPLPGNFSGPVPLTSTYDSGVIIYTVTGNTFDGNFNNTLVSGVKSDRVGQNTGVDGAAVVPWAQQADRLPLIMPNYNGAIGDYITLLGFYRFAETNLWTGVKKITVYTNLTQPSMFRIGIHGQQNLYDINTNVFIKAGTSGANSGPYTDTTGVINGTILNSGSIVQANIGDPGTYFGSMEYGVDASLLTSSFGSFVGDKNDGVVATTNIFGQPINTNGISCNRVAFSIKPAPTYNYGTTLTDFKFRFVIEYFQ